MLLFERDRIFVAALLATGSTTSEPRIHTRASSGESRWLAGSCGRWVGNFFSAGARWSDRSRRRGCERRTRSTDLQQEIEGDKVRERVGQREKERRRGNSPEVRRRRRGLSSVTPLQLAASLLLRGHGSRTDKRRRRWEKRRRRWSEIT